jgi:hypothetical protein
VDTSFVHNKLFTQHEQGDAAKEPVVQFRNRKIIIPRAINTDIDAEGAAGVVNSPVAQFRFGKLVIP